MKTYQQVEMERLIEMKWLIKKSRIDAFNTQNASSFSNRSLLQCVITKEMIEEAKKGIQDCDMHPVDRQKKLKKLHKSLMYRLNTLFVHEPRLKKICKYMYNKLVFSCFTEYAFSPSYDDNEKKLNDLKYVLKFCGYNLTYVKVFGYHFSHIMPLINTNCPGLKKLVVVLKEIEDKDFENVFSNMHQLETLSVLWECEKSTLPMTLIKSLEEVGGTLKTLSFTSNSKDGCFLPDSLAPVFSQLIALEHLDVHGFRLSQAVIQSISETKSLTELHLLLPHDHPMINEKINMSPIGNLKNLKRLSIHWNCGDIDELFINLGDNAKKLKDFHILGTNITDNGMMAVNNLSQLEVLNLSLCTLNKTNNFITDKSIQCLLNEKLQSLDLSNCTKISNRSVITLFENLPNLAYLTLRNTNVTIEAAKELSKLTKFHKEKLRVFVPFKDCNGIFKSILGSHNVEFMFESN
ncbi:uncharacterized protein LOC122849363 [Aphidius gifuensis]|uniref:uncharacterized protein LOC122849363 n=1 Tax=Aphidius gifuensis TaxID=684658 RepID=UPI001CDD5ED6|nr:uncharacterized protein LOC122849363 [Aphidius gifuensis]